MKRFTLMAAFAAIAIALAAGAYHVRAETSGGPPWDGVPCYHNLWTCSYEDSDAYWSGCAVQYPGLISTGTAKSICTDYHSS